MRWDARPPHWENTNTKIAKGLGTTVRTDILYSHARYLNPWSAAAWTARNMGCGNVHQKATQTTGQIERQKYRETDGHTNLTGPHWVPLEPSLGINTSQKCTATLIINTQTKISKGPQTTVRTDGYIILPLTGFDPVACGRMRCTQLRTTQTIAKMWRGRPDR